MDNINNKNLENGLKSKTLLDQMTQDIINKSQKKELSIGEGIDVDSLVARFASSERGNLIQNFVKEETDIYFRKPSEIADNPDEQKKREDLYLFQLLDALYTTPLYEMANRISLQNYRKPAVFSDLANASIFGRLVTIRTFLEKSGVTLPEIKNVIPVKEEDFLVLSQAYKKGFLLEDYSKEKDLSNAGRVRRAKEYLEKQDSNDYDKKSK